MSLLERQIAFREEIIAPDDGAAPSSTGMAIYRDAYRGRLLAALEVSFERTRRWVGEEAFIAAAAHYILLHPPTGWTLDAYGTGFPDVLAELFRDDPEVAELAWLEWHMQQAFAAPDKPTLDPAALAAAGYAEADWEHMRFTMAPGFAGRAIATNCAALWAHANAEEPGNFEVGRAEGLGLLVWRPGLSPHYRTAPIAELAALTALEAGTSLGELGSHLEATTLGRWLAQWLQEGMLSTATVRGAVSQSPAIRTAF